MKLTDDAISQFKQKLIPLLLKSCEISLDAYNAGFEKDGKNYFQDGSIGYCSWENSTARIKEQLDGDDFFTVKNVNNSLEISFKNESDIVNFCIYRVDKKYIPTSGKKIKKIANYEQGFLSEEIGKRLKNSREHFYILCYQLDKAEGIGEIAFCDFCAIDKDVYQSELIHLFDTARITVPAETDITEEEIKAPHLEKIGEKEEGQKEEAK